MTVKVAFANGIVKSYDWQGPPTWEWLQKKIEGSVEIINSVPFGHWQLIVNEDGALIDLDRNQIMPQLHGNVVELTGKNILR